MIFSHNSTLDNWLLRGTSQDFKTMIETDFKKRNKEHFAKLRLACYDPFLSQCQLFDDFTFGHFDFEREIAYFYPTVHDKYWRYCYKRVLEELSKNSAAINADASGVTRRGRRLLTPFEFRRNEEEKKFGSEKIPLFGLNVDERILEIEFKWMPTFAALLREDLVRERAKKIASEKRARRRRRAGVR